MITETIRGMNYVSPLATMKFSNRSPDDILNIYFPAAEITTFKKTDIIIDKDCPVKPEDFIVKKFGTDTDGDGTGDSFAFYLALFISNDGLKVREAYECTTPREDELVLFVENNENDVSNQVLFAKIHPELRKKFTMQNGSLNPNLFDEDILKVVNENGGGISLEILEELVVNGKIEEKIIPPKMALNGITYLLYAMTAPAKAVGWLCRKAGEGIDMLKISEEFWDVQSDEYFLKKENVIKSLQADTAILDRWYARFQDDPEKLEWKDLIPGFIEEKTKNVYEDLKAYAHKYNQFVESNIDALYAQIDKTGVVDLLKIKESIALYCGMWNGLVDFVSSIFHFASMILEAPFDMAPDMEYMLEIYDNCAEVFRKMDFIQIGVMLTGMYEEIKKHFKEKDGEDYDLVRIAYCVGFLLVFIATFFIPYAALLKIANIGKVGKMGEILTKFMNEVGGAYTKSVNFIEQKTAQALRSSLSSLQGMLEIFSETQKLKAFLERVWKTIAEWFAKNNKLFNSLVGDIKNAFSKEGKTEEFFRKIEKKLNLAGEEILTYTDIKRLRRLLKETFEVPLEFVDQNPKLRSKLNDWKKRRVAGSFNMAEGKMYLRKSVTAYTVQHEMFHMKLWYKMTKEFPELQPLFQKTLGRENILFHEEYVLAEFMKNPSKWKEADLLNDLNNINDLRTERSLPKVDLEYLKKWDLEEELLKFK